MANWDTLKAAVNGVIKTNGNQEITGAVLQSTLNNIIGSVGEKATFAGVATPSTNPGAPDGPVFYIACEPGTYSNFGGAVLSNTLSVLLWTAGSWRAISVDGAILSKISDAESQSPINNIISKGTVISRLDRDLLNDGYYINAANGNITAFAGTAASDFIYIKPGGTYICDCYIYGSSAGIAFYDESQAFISSLKPNIKGGTYSFTAPSGSKYLRYCRTAAYNSSLVYTGSTPYAVENKAIFDELRAAIDAEAPKRIISNNWLEKTAEVSLTTGRYIGSSGRIGSSAGHFYTSGLSVKAGSTVIAFAAGAGSGKNYNLSTIAKVKTEGSLYEPLVLKRAYGLTENYDLGISQYYVTEDCTLAFSGTTSYGFALYVSQSDIADQLYKEAAALSSANKVLTTSLYDRYLNLIGTNDASNVPSTIGRYLLKTDKIGVSLAGGGVSDYFFVKGLSKVHYSGAVGLYSVDVAIMNFYDENKALIASEYTTKTSTGAAREHLTAVTEVDIDVPSGAVFARCSSVLSQLKVTVVDDNKNADFINDALVNYADSIEARAKEKAQSGIDYKVSTDFTSFFDKCLCIGDSVTAGHVYDYPRTRENYGDVIPECSYPTYLQRMTRWSVVKNSAVPGYSPGDWWTNLYPTHTYTDYQIALMELGLNGGLTDTLDTDVEPYDDYNDYANTGTGNYCKIVEAIKASNPNITLVLLIPAYWGPTTVGSAVIKKIASKYNLHIIDLNDSSYINLNGLEYHGLTTASVASINMVHFNRMGYCAKAKVIYNALSGIIRNNAKQINDAQPSVVTQNS